MNFYTKEEFRILRKIFYEKRHIRNSFALLDKKVYDAFKEVDSTRALRVLNKVIKIIKSNKEIFADGYGIGLTLARDMIFHMAIEEIPKYVSTGGFASVVFKWRMSIGK